MYWFFYEFTPSYPYLSSAINFLIFGTIGEWVGGVILKKKFIPFSPWKVVPKIIIWALIGVLVKWAFSSFVLLVRAQAQYGLIPSASRVEGSFWFAFFVSLQMNLFFGPIVIFLHRAFNNIIERKFNWTGLHIAIYAIGWFWIPIHTITFMLEVNYQIIFAAILSIMLGVILGYSNRKNR